MLNKIFKIRALKSIEMIASQRNHTYHMRIKHMIDIE